MRAEHPYKLRSIEIEDFKSISHAAVEFHPLSIVVGANSSGKSSLLQVILAISQAVRSQSPGAAFPLNGEYARFGKFSETARFARSHDDNPTETEKRIKTRATIVVDDPGFPRRSHGKKSESADEHVYTDWSLHLVPDADSGSDTATIRSVRLRSYEQHDGRELRTLLQYDLENLADIKSEDKKLDYRVLTGRRRILPNQPGLTSVDGSYLTRRDTTDMERFECDAVKLRGAIPRDVYALSKFSDAIGRHWWSAAKRFVAISRLNDSNSQRGSRSQSADAEAGEDLQTIVELAVSTAQAIQEDWSEQSDSHPHNPPLYWQLHSILHEQLDEAEDSERRERITRGLETHGIETFLEELYQQLKSEPWADDKVWTSPDSLLNPGVSWSGWAIHRFFDGNVKYLGPLRMAPQVLYAPRLRDLDLGLSGEYTAAVLHANSDRRVVPISDAEPSDVTLESEVNFWLRRFGLAREASLTDRGRLGIGLKITTVDNKQSVDLTSVGVGVSQILPVIVLCLLAEPGDLIILEQPELHLHPALQQQLGDFLLDCANSGRQLLVETHSEHLVNRVRRRVADVTGSDEGMVGLIFAEQHAGTTRFTQSAVNRYGGTESEWPEGFFDVSSNEAQALVSTSLTKRHRDAS